MNCIECDNKIAHSIAMCSNGIGLLVPTLWNDDEPDLEKRVAELELRLDEVWNRMKQYEAVMSTAFRLAPTGELKRYDK